MTKFSYSFSFYFFLPYSCGGRLANRLSYSVFLTAKAPDILQQLLPFRPVAVTDNYASHRFLSLHIVTLLNFKYTDNDDCLQPVGRKSPVFGRNFYCGNVLFPIKLWFFPKLVEI